MSINVTIVTTANRIRQFVQTDETCIQETLQSLERSSQLFTNRALIIGSGEETEIFSPATITRIQFHTTRELAPFVPQLSQTFLSLIPDGATTPAAVLTEHRVASKIDFFFSGGDSVALWLDAPRPTGGNERRAQLTRLFEQAVITYKLPEGGIGFMNPVAMTRARIATGVQDLPLGAWRLNPA